MFLIKAISLGNILMQKLTFLHLGCDSKNGKKNNLITRKGLFL